MGWIGTTVVDSWPWFHGFPQLPYQSEIWQLHGWDVKKLAHFLELTIC